MDKLLAQFARRPGVAGLVLVSSWCVALPVGCQGSAGIQNETTSRTALALNEGPTGADHEWSLDEASGTTANDTGNPGGDNGTLGSSVTRFSPGLIGAGAVTLPGGSANSVVSLGSVGTVGTGDFTATYWMRTSTTSSNSELLGNRSCGSSCNFWGMRETSTGVAFEMYQDGSGTNGANVGVSVNVENGNWHFIAARRSGTSVTLFVDGTSQSTTTAGVTNITTTTALTFGNNPVAGTFSTTYAGDVDEIRVYNHALADCEILGTCPGGVHAWTLDEASGTTAIDEGTPGGDNGTLGSAVTRVTPGKVGAGAVTLPGGSANSVLSFGGAGQVGVGDFTATYWMRTSTTSSNSELLGNRSCGSSCNFWGMRETSTGVAFEMYQDGSGTNGANVGVSVNVEDGNWHFVAARRAGTNVTLFVDGTSQSTTAAGVTNITTTTALTFGNNPIAGTYSTTYAGDVDDIRLYDRALANCEILGTCSGPVHAWPLDEASGTTAIDDGTPGGVNGTLGSAVTRLAPGRLGTGAATLPGGSANSVISFGTSGTVGTSDFTATYWMRTSTSTTISELLGNRSCVPGCNFWGMRETPTAVAFEMYEDALLTNGAAVNLAVNVADGNWHFIAARRAGTNVTLFVDGSSQSTTAAGVTNITTTTPLTFGNNPIAVASGTTYAGDVDEIRLYNRALPDCELLGVACTAPDGCHAGVLCNRTTGLCSDPAEVADGTSCTGGTCQAGVCIASADAGADASADGGSGDSGVTVGDGGPAEAGSTDSGTSSGDAGSGAGDGGSTDSGTSSGDGGSTTADSGAATDGGPSDGGGIVSEGGSAEAGIANDGATASNGDSSAGGDASSEDGATEEASTVGASGDASSEGGTEAASPGGGGGCGCHTAGTTASNRSSLFAVAPFIVFAFRRRARSKRNART